MRSQAWLWNSSVTWLYFACVIFPTISYSCALASTRVRLTDILVSGMTGLDFLASFRVQLFSGREQWRGEGKLERCGNNTERGYCKIIYVVFYRSRGSSGCWSDHASLLSLWPRSQHRFQNGKHFLA